MRSILLLAVSCFLLAGCAHKIAIPVTVPFPTTPPELRQECEALSQLAANAKLSDLMITVTENYIKYHECKTKNQAWNDWYTQQKEIFDAASGTNKKK